MIPYEKRDAQCGTIPVVKGEHAHTKKGRDDEMSQDDGRSVLWVLPRGMDRR